MVVVVEEVVVTVVVVVVVVVESVEEREIEGSVTVSLFLKLQFDIAMVIAK